MNFVYGRRIVHHNARRYGLPVVLISVYAMYRSSTFTRNELLFWDTNRQLSHTTPRFYHRYLPTVTYVLWPSWYAVLVPTYFTEMTAIVFTSEKKHKKKPCTASYRAMRNSIPICHYVLNFAMSLWDTENTYLLERSCVEPFKIVYRNLKNIGVCFVYLYSLDHAEIAKICRVLRV